MRVTWFLPSFEIQTCSSIAIQSGLPPISKTASGLSSSAGIRRLAFLMPGLGGGGWRGGFWGEWAIARAEKPAKTTEITNMRMRPRPGPIIPFAHEGPPDSSPGTVVGRRRPGRRRYPSRRFGPETTGTAADRRRDRVLRSQGASDPCDLLPGVPWQEGRRRAQAEFTRSHPAGWQF